MITMARSGPRPQFMPTTSAPAARRFLATSAGLSPHIVRSRSCRSSNWKNIVAITGRSVTALRERRGLLPERLLVLLVGHARVQRVILGESARGADGARDEAARGRDLAREPRPLDVQLTRAVAQRVLVELEPRAAERVGLDDVAARVKIALVDAGHDVGVGVVPQLGARAVEQAGREQHGAVAAVEDERVSGLDALHDLPAARLHAETATPSSIFAFTT